MFTAHRWPGGSVALISRVQQLVGTVLSLWDATELDAAGDDGEVVPNFINLADASIKMVCVASTYRIDQLTWPRFNLYP